jgi:hypothetical protein
MQPSLCFKGCLKNSLSVREALDNPGVAPRLTSKSLAASRMLRVLVEVFQSFLSHGKLFELESRLYNSPSIKAGPES